MLKGIPEILSPELLKVLCEMGHSDRLVIADGNFPVESMGKNAITIRCDGHGVPEILDAILKLFPLDTYVEHPVNLMEVMHGVRARAWMSRPSSVAKTQSLTSRVNLLSPRSRSHHQPLTTRPTAFRWRTTASLRFTRARQARL